MKTEEKIIKLIKENSNCNKVINADSRFIEDLKIDSFDRLMIVNAIEDEYGIEVDTEDIKKFKTVKDIVFALESNYIVK